jgi:hypothetical protein
MFFPALVAVNCRSNACHNEKLRHFADFLAAKYLKGKKNYYLDDTLSPPAEGLSKKICAQAAQANNSVAAWLWKRDATVEGGPLSTLCTFISKKDFVEGIGVEGAFRACQFGPECVMLGLNNKMKGQVRRYERWSPLASALTHPHPMLALPAREAAPFNCPYPVCLQYFTGPVAIFKGLRKCKSCVWEAR